MKLIFYKTECNMMAGVVMDMNLRMQYQENLRRIAEQNSVSMVYRRGTFFERVEEQLNRERAIPHCIC